ncbi:MAG: acyl-CoA thioesterase-1 [Sulfurimonas sp.]
MNKVIFTAILLFIVISLLIITKENKENSHEPMLKETSVILAFGDSLTYGFGASHEFSYPKQIQMKTGVKVINAGINGELTSEGLLRLPRLLEHKPDLVILCHGGNDILNKIPSSELKNNLLVMIKLIQDSGVKVLLVSVPDFALVTFHAHAIYEEVANETSVLFEDNVLEHIERNRSLKSDYVHPNAKGYEVMADAFIEILGIKTIK